MVWIVPSVLGYLREKYGFSEGILHTDLDCVFDNSEEEFYFEHKNNCYYVFGIQISQHIFESFGNELWHVVCHSFTKEEFVKKLQILLWHKQGLIYFKPRENEETFKILNIIEFGEEYSEEDWRRTIPFSTVKEFVRNYELLDHSDLEPRFVISGQKWLIERVLSRGEI